MDQHNLSEYSLTEQILLLVAILTVWQRVSPGGRPLKRAILLASLLSLIQYCQRAEHRHLEAYRCKVERASATSRCWFPPLVLQDRRVSTAAATVPPIEPLVLLEVVICFPVDLFSVAVDRLVLNTVHLLDKVVVGEQARNLFDSLAQLLRGVLFDNLFKPIGGMLILVAILLWTCSLSTNIWPWLGTITGWSSGLGAVVRLKKSLGEDEEDQKKKFFE